MTTETLRLFPSIKATEGPFENHPSSQIPVRKILPIPVRERGLVSIRVARTEMERSLAKTLVQRMYSLRGFKCENIVLDSPQSTTLVAERERGGIIGTVTIHCDSPEEGLHSDDGYKWEIDSLRLNGRKLCEFNGLAIDPGVNSKRLLARLFHVAMIYPAEMFGITDCIIEVSFSHAKFYERQLGFRRIAEGRACRRVDSVGALLHAEFSSLEENLLKVGGLMKKASGEKNFFPYGLSRSEAKRVLFRLKISQLSGGWLREPNLIQSAI
jgi:hypothetical protein